jgi:glycerophosphoryl diester phosphodiesterase
MPTCCTSDFTLEELKTLCAKMDSYNDINATDPMDFAFGGTADWRTDLYQYECPRVMTHKESIEIIKAVGGKFTPELKLPSVEMPFNDFTQRDFAVKLTEEFMAAGIPTEDIWIQSATEEDIEYLATTDYGMQAVALDFDDTRNRSDDKAWLMHMMDIGAKIVAPPMWKLVEPNPKAGEEGELDMVASQMALDAKELGLQIITWTLERTSAPLEKPAGTDYFWLTLQGMGLNLTEGSNMDLLHVLAMDVGIEGIFRWVDALQDGLSDLWC